MAEARAVVFDLDDTLYPLRSFLLSGFAAVAARLERDYELPADRSLRALRYAFAHGRRGRELQYICNRFALPPTIVLALVGVIREHAPAIQLPALSERVLRALRPSWRLGVLTNGLPSVQARKAEALGLRGLVDAVVYASECGDGRGKPAPEGFLAVLSELDVDPSSAVFVGDHEDTDVAGAAAIGMKTIHFAPRRAAASARRARVRSDARVSCLREVPPVAGRLVQTHRRSRAF